MKPRVSRDVYGQVAYYLGNLRLIREHRRAEVLWPTGVRQAVDIVWVSSAEDGPSGRREVLTPLVSLDHHGVTFTTPLLDLDVLGLSVGRDG